MKCNVSHQSGKQKPNKIALIKNKKKIQRVGELGMLYDKLEAKYNLLPDGSPDRVEIKAQMDEIEEKIKTLSAEIKAEVYKKPKNSTNVEEVACEESALSGDNDIIENNESSDSQK